MMKNVLSAIAVLLVLLCAAPQQSYADEATDKMQARKHYAAGLRAYNIGEFDAAIKDWKSAYQLHGAPDFLFNIAQGYRQLRNYDQAIFFYNAYLRAKVDAPNAADVTALRDEMIVLRDEQLKNEQLAPKPEELLGPSTQEVAIPDQAGNANTKDSGRPIETAATSNASDREPTSLFKGPGASLRISGVVAGTGGLAALATGIAFALSASSTEQDLESNAAQQKPWNPDTEARGEFKATLATALTIGGVGALAGGALLYFLGHKKGQENDSVASLQLMPSYQATSQGRGTGLAVGIRF